MKKMKKFFIFASLILISAAAVFAQAVTSSSPAMPNWSSPQFTATQGRFRSAADNFIRPDYYNAVTFDKFFAMTSFAATDKAQLGYAGKIGNMYIGAAYGGNFWANYTDLTYTEQEYAAWPGGSKKVPVYGFNYSNPFTSKTPENRIAVLLGLADMGFRFTFSSVGHELISLKDSVVGGSAVKSYEAERGRIIPQIAWAMAKDLSENGIRPYVLLDLGFTRDYIKGETISAIGPNNAYVGYSENSFDPKLTLGLGGYTFYKNEGGFKLLADFEYALELRIFENEYSYQNGTGYYEIAKIKGINGGGSGGLSEDTYSGHLLTPALAGQWSGGPLALRFRLNLPVTFVGAESTDMTINGSGLDSGDKSSLSFIGFNPNLVLAAQWKIVSKLTLNVGGRITLGNIGQETTETTSKGTPGIPSTSTKTITGRRGASSNQLTIGFTFLPTDNLTFEASSGIGTNNAINFTEDYGLLNFTSLLVGVRF
jgi:hypothetical protein